MFCLYLAYFLFIARIDAARGFIQSQCSTIYVNLMQALAASLRIDFCNEWKRALMFTFASWTERKISKPINKPTTVILTT